MEPLARACGTTRPSPIRRCLSRPAPRLRASSLIREPRRHEPAADVSALSGYGAAVSSGRVAAGQRILLGENMISLRAVLCASAVYASTAFAGVGATFPACTAEIRKHCADVADQHL